VVNAIAWRAAICPGQICRWRDAAENTAPPAAEWPGVLLRAGD
jgi:hypothetical protein